MTNNSSTVGYFGIGLGAIALLVAITHFWAGPFSPQPSLESTVAETAVAIRNATISALKGEEAKGKRSTRRAIDLDQGLQIAAAILGGLAIILGVVSFARRESIRVGGGAAVLGGAAIAFQFAVVALGAILFAILVVGVLSQLGFD